MTGKLDNCQGVLREEEIRKLVDLHEINSTFSSHETMREMPKKFKGVLREIEIKGKTGITD